MDTRLRLIDRRRAASGAPEDEAVLLNSRLRAGDISQEQLLVVLAAGILPILNREMGRSPEQASAECRQFLPAPSRPELFKQMIVQVKVVWNLNQRLGWGLTACDFAAATLPTTWPTDDQHNLTAVTLVPYLDTVGETFEGLLRAIQVRHNSPYRVPELTSDEQHLKLLDGIVHPGKSLRWETIDMAANWDRANGIAPRDARNTRSPHAGILAAGAIHKSWVEAFDGDRVPCVWAAGYEMRLKPAGPWLFVPYLHYDQPDRRACIYSNTDDWISPHYAGPAPRE